VTEKIVFLALVEGEVIAAEAVQHIVLSVKNV
jgi:hypothetical protein